MTEQELPGRQAGRQAGSILGEVHVDRMIALGRLAAGVGHEINNPLAYIIANLDFVARELKDLAHAGAALPAEVRERLDGCEEALRDARDGANRVRAVVKDLRTFSHSDEERREPVEVTRAADAAIRITWNEIRHRARLERDYQAANEVFADEKRLVQVFTNLLVNAAQAIPIGRADANEIKVRVASDGGRVVVEISDTGGGIPPDHLHLVFEPFFTTKKRGEGTGLGLSVAREIVRAHGGELKVTSTVGKGSVFRAEFPVARSVARSPSTLEKTPSFPGRRGRLLAIEDEALIGEALRRLLDQEHELIHARSGPEALALLESGEKFDAILCDVMMPEMSGIDVLDAISTRWPALAPKVVFMTGGAFAPSVRESLDRLPNPVLEKPFEISRLRGVISSLLQAQ